MTKERGHVVLRARNKWSDLMEAGRALMLMRLHDGFPREPARHVCLGRTEFLRAEGVRQETYALERPQLWFEHGEPCALLCVASITPEVQSTGTFNVALPLRPTVSRIAGRWCAYSHPAGEVSSATTNHMSSRFNTTRNHLFGTLLLTATLGAAGVMPRPGAPTIPFPDALAAASVRIDRVDPSPLVNLRSNGLVVGNGEMNAIVYVSGGDLRLRISKNDVWDGRIDTSEDPAIPKVDPATHTLHREKPGNPPSWKKPYPCAVPPADIMLAGGNVAAVWRMELDLATAAATATTGSERIAVRALAHANVFLIETERDLELGPVPQTFLPAATLGREEAGFQWLRQTIPGDEDAKGMEVFLVGARQGARWAVAVVTSSDTPEPFERARDLVRGVLAEAHHTAVARHEAIWREFWARSGVRLGQKQFQAWWYRMVYYFRCFARRDATAVGLKASFDALAGWHNSYKFNYNIQQTYFSAAPINQPELLEPLINVLQNYWPRARWFARTHFIGCEGAFVHADVFHPHEPDPATSTSRNQHQFAYIPFGYSLGMQGHISFLLWEHFLYTPDRGFLRLKTYPMIRDIGLFYCSFLEKCASDAAGRLIIGPSYFPENGYFGQDNTAYDIPFITYGLRAARDAALTLELDPELVQRIERLLPKLPDYPVLPDPLQQGRSVVTYYRGAKLPDDDRHASLVMAVFPAGTVSWFSAPEQKDLFRRTLGLVGRITTHANSPVTLAIARARLSLPEEAVQNIEVDFTQHHREQPNGLFSWKAHGYYISEQVGIARMIAELLLQSVEGKMRVFPAWPVGQDAEFARLRAIGGFLVSGRLLGGNIGPISVESTVGGEARLVNPWPGQRVQIVAVAQSRPVPSTATGDLVSFPTTAGESYTISVLR